MLSRVADNFYWMGRYMERANCLSRLLLIQIQEMPEDTPDFLSASWKGIFYSLKIPHEGGFLIDEKEPANSSDDFLLADAYTLIDYLTFETYHSGSILSCLEYARENARQNREKITGFMWPHINKTYLRVKKTNLQGLWPDKVINLYKDILESVYLFYGLVEDSLYQNEAVYFIQMGRYLERFQNTTSLIESHIQLMMSRKEEEEDLIGLLLRCGALDHFRQVYSLDLKFRKVIEFLFYDSNFSGSLKFCSSQLKKSLSLIEKKDKFNGSIYQTLEGIETQMQNPNIDRPMAQFLNFLYKDSVQANEQLSSLYLTYKSFDVFTKSDQ